MIRCIPVDGGEAFEVENEHDCLVIVDGEPPAVTPASCLAMFGGAPEPWDVCVFDRRVHVESWRERAERLEHENALLRLARDYNAVPHAYQFDIEADGSSLDVERDAIEAKIVALGCSLAEAQNI